MPNISGRKGAFANPDPKNDGKFKLHVVKRLAGYLLRHKGSVLLACALMISSNLFALVGPQLSGRAIDAVEGGAGQVDFRSAVFYCALMLLFYIASGVLGYALSVVMINLSRKIVYAMRKEAFDHLMTLPVGYFDRTPFGDIVSHLSYDIDTINASLSNDLLQICGSVITIAGSLIMMLRICPVLVLVFAVTVPISTAFTTYKSKRVHPLFRTRSARLGELNGFSEEMLSGHRTIKAYNREDVIIERFASRNDEAVEAYYQADYHACIVGPSVNFINNLSLSLISMLGSILYLLGRVHLSAISTFILYSRKFSGPINEMANIISELQSACAAAERVFALIDEPSEIPDQPDACVLRDVSGALAMRHVHFGYTPEKQILHDLCFEAAPGKTVAIVGPTGAGKTTIINLLMRFYDPQQGEILLDGHELRQIVRSSLRLSYSMVLQDTWLFYGTIFDNIAYGKEGATEQEVVEAARAAHVHSFIESLPDGYQTVLSDDGVNISKGQKQLLTIARAMLCPAPMLILDEATSNVDSRTEQEIQHAMRQLMRNKTCFVIAHRLSTIQNADVILVMRGGSIIEQGTHDQLLQSGGFYASLYNSQFS